MEKKFEVIKEIVSKIGDKVIEVNIPIKVNLEWLGIEVEGTINKLSKSTCSDGDILTMEFPYRKGIGYFDCYLNGEECIDFNYMHYKDDVEYNDGIDDKVFPIEFFNEILKSL